MLVGMEDVQGMANAIVRVARMPNAEWQAMSDAAFQTSKAYSWETATDQFEAAVEAARTSDPQTPRSGRAES